MTAPILDCTGVLVAGGRAARMGGVAKGLLRASDEPIAARSLRLFERLFGAALIVADDPSTYAGLGAPIVPDVFPGKGAPGGVHAGLAAAGTEWVFAAGCDMPFLSADAIAALASLRGDAAVAGVVWRGRFEGLHAFWSRRALPTIERLLREGGPSLWALAAAAGARMVTEEEWLALELDGRSFENVNTPDDAARLGLAPPGAP